MLIMTQDRISGLAANKSPLGTYGPGNTQDESNRNSWISSDGNDSLTINCLGQVNGLFLGRYQSDEILLTYQGDELFGNKTSSGFLGVGYANGSSGVITGTIHSIEPVPSGYYYNTGTLVTISLNSDSDYINVNDLIQITGSASQFNGNHRVVQVQKESSFTRLNAEGHSLFFQQQGQTGSKIQVIHKDNITTLEQYLTSGSSLSVQNGLSFSLIASGAGSQVGLIVDEDDINFKYFITFGHSAANLLRSGDSPFTVGEYVSFEDCIVRTISGSLTSEDLDYVNNSYKSYIVSAVSSFNSSFTIEVSPSQYYSSNLVSVVTSSGSPVVHFGSSFVYNGGGYQHKLGLGLISGTTLSSGSEEFENNEVIEMSNASISSITLGSNGINQLALNGIEQEFLHKATVKNRAQFSIKLPYKFKAGSPLVNTAFTFSSSDSISLRKYVTDTGDAETTTDGVGTPIRRISVATRTQNSVSDFVIGKLIKVESNYIPLPREAFPTKIFIEMNATLNHNAANLFNQFLLEEVNVENPNLSVNTGVITITSDSSYAANSLSVGSYKYNNNTNGELTLYFGSDTRIEADDFIYLNWPNNIGAQNNQISKTVSSALITATTFRTTTPIHELYKGMKINGSGNLYVLNVNTGLNEITTNIAHGLSDGDPVTFDHHVDLGDDASNGWTGYHRVTSVANNGRTITFFVPNSGVKGDLTINDNAYSTSPGTYNASGASVTIVTGGKGRFVRPIADGINSCDAFLWNSHESNTVNYTYGGVVYPILPGTAKLFFSSPHGLVNNDKILFYDLLSNTTGAQYLRNLDSSYLVTYTTSNVVTISIKKSISKAISAISVASSTDAANGILTIVTTNDHGFSTGERVSLVNIPDYPQNYEILSTPTVKSFTVNVGSAISSSYNPTLTGSPEAITGVHYLTNFTSNYETNRISSNILNVPCSRSISIADAISSFENPIEVGNLLYRDAYQYSSSQYEAVNDSTATFTKSPSIDDAASTTPYRPDSDTAIQNTFAGTANSIVSQINLIRGDATAEKDIQLVKPFGVLNKPFVFTKLLQGLRVAIVRAGVSRQLPNPQVGVTNALKDFSVRKELPTGAYYYLNRDSAKEFSGNIQSDPESVDQLIDFSAEQLARPFPCLVISGTGTSMRKLRTRTALYGYFTTLPQATFVSKLNNLKEASFTIREVL